MCKRNQVLKSSYNKTSFHFQCGPRIRVKRVLTYFFPRKKILECKWTLENCESFGVTKKIKNWCPSLWLRAEPIYEVNRTIQSMINEYVSTNDKLMLLLAIEVWCGRTTMCKNFELNNEAKYFDGRTKTSRLYQNDIWMNTRNSV